MPGTDPIVAANPAPRTNHIPSSPPTGSSPQPPSAAEVRDEATAALTALQHRRSRAPMSPESAMTRIATVFEAGQEEGHALRSVRKALDDNPRLLRTLAAIPEDRLLSTLRDKVGVWDGGALAEEIKDHIRARLIDSVRQDAFRRVDRQIGTLQRARAELTARLPEMDAGEQAQAQAALAILDRGIEGYRGLKARLYGNRWSLGDFQRAGERAMLSNGFAARGVAWELLTESDRTADYAHAGEAGIHLLVDGIELGHLAHTFGAASVGAVLGVAALGIAAGMYIHHAAAEIHAHDVALGRRLGL